MVWRHHYLASRLLLLLVSHVLSVSVTDSCVIRATLYMTSPAERSVADFGLPLDIDCNSNENIMSGGAGSGGAAALALEISSLRVAGKQHVLLDGSKTPPLAMTSYGLEYLDSCRQVKTLQIERFVADATFPLHCAEATVEDWKNLEQMSSVYLRNNEINALSGKTFEKTPQLRHLQLENNKLRIVEPLIGCQNLQELMIVHEMELELSDGSSFFNGLEELKRLHLVQLKLIHFEVFADLPTNLTELYVKQTPIENHTVEIPNVNSLENITIVQCQLERIKLQQENLQRLNLSGNSLLFLDLQQTDNLVSLDLSENQLQALPKSWMSSLPQLMELLLNGNRLHTLSLAELLRIAPHTLQSLDLRDNQLVELYDAGEEAERVAASQLRIQIDRNPWSCQWVLNFTHSQPQMFHRFFQYAKYISQINVNGLSCRPAAAAALIPSPSSSTVAPRLIPSRFQKLEHNGTRGNISSFTVIYGNPLEMKRSQRSNALIIVFLLPLGIALLFLLLYLYLHCERLFHLSYYMSGMRCNKFSGSAQRVDIVRFPAINHNGDILDGYETPHPDASSICNCTQRQSSCTRTHHITYEALPAELPQQLYAEIKEQSDITLPVTDDLHKATAPIYDHLSFEDEQEQQHPEALTLKIS